MADEKRTLPDFIAELGSNILLEVTKSGQLLFFNSKAACVLGRICKGSMLSEILPADKWNFLLQNIDTAFYQQYPHHFYFGFNHRFYLVYVYPHDKSVWLLFDDVTEGRMQAHLLYLNAQRMMFVERLSKMGYWELDFTNRRFYWSDEMYIIFGVEKNSNETRRNLIRELMHPDDLLLYKQKLKELLRSEQNIEGQVRIITPDKELKYCRFAAGIVYEHGMAKAAGVFQDISYLVKIQKDLEKARKAAEEANLAKSYFLAAASHDIRQPLQALNLFAEALKNAEVSKQREIIDKIERLSFNLTSLLNNLLDISKIDAGGVCFEPHNFDIADFLGGICAEYKILAMDKKIELKCRIKSKIIYQDAFLLERIVHNLLDNALKYAKGKIVVSNSGRKIYVIDDGVGIDKDKQKRIFEIFYQCDNRNIKTKSGIGLGLNIAWKMAEIIGAKIKVKSQKNRYSMFVVEW